MRNTDRASALTDHSLVRKTNSIQRMTHKCRTTWETGATRKGYTWDESTLRVELIRGDRKASFS